MKQNLFEPIIRHYNHDLTKRWRVEYYAPVNDSREIKRVVVYGNINKMDTTELRLAEANKIIGSLSLTPIRKDEVLPAEYKNCLFSVLKDMSLQWRIATTRSYTTVAKSFSKYMNARRLRVEVATYDHVVDWLQQLQNRQEKTQASAYKYRDLLCIMFSHANRLGYVRHNPVTKVGRATKSAKSLMYFNNDQIKAMLGERERMSKQLYLAIHLLYCTFIRPNEMRYLQIKHIAMDKMYIQLEKSFTKNKKTQKVIIPDILVQPLREYMGKSAGTLYLFSEKDKTGNKKIGQNKLYTEHKKIMERVGIIGDYSFYSWKHTGVVKCVKAGINVKDLQLQLRHHSLDMVNEYLKNLGVMDSDDIKHRFPSLL